MRARTLVGPVLAILLFAACSTSNTSDRAIEQLIESGEGISNVAVSNGEIAVEFDESEGGGLLSLGGGVVPAGLPIPVLDGGQVVSSVEQGETFAVALQYPVGRHGELLALYEDWVTGLAPGSVAETRSTNPRSNGWIGETDGASFRIVVQEDPGNSEDKGVSVVVTWEA